MSTYGFLPSAIVIGGIIVGAILVYTILYSIHLKLFETFGVIWAWPLLALYLVSAAISLISAALAYWQRTGPHYGFYGDDRYMHEYAHIGSQPLYSFALLFLLSCLLLFSAQHALATVNSAQTKS